jgi:hypothetical protein
MTNRTLAIKGVGFHATQASIRVKIDGNIVYEGPVLTDTTNPYNLQGSPLLTTLNDGVPVLTPVYSWEESMEFAGTHQLEIMATAGDFLYTHAQSNFMPVALKTNPTEMFSTGKGLWISCFAEEQSPGNVYREPNSNVIIDGVEQGRTVINSNQQYGQFYRGIPEGKTLTCTLNISAGLEEPMFAPPWDHTLGSYYGFEV